METRHHQSLLAIGLPPAGGCVTFKAIISIIAIPTANPIEIKETSKKCNKNNSHKCS